jgi:hypothetical protein
MKNHFACPHCRATLNPNVKVTLVASYRSRKGMILLSPQPGDFKYVCDPTVEEGLEPGDLVAFACPVCHGDLTSPRDARFAELRLHIPGSDERVIEFSREFGTHATFIIDGDEITAFGEDAEGYDEKNFFGA